MERKSLKELSLQITEEEYRADPALSYSTLARYEREGFKSLEHLYDKIETPSLTFGSAVDALITGGQEEFDSKFLTAEFPRIPDTIILIVKDLFRQYGHNTRYLEGIGMEDTLRVIDQYNYSPNWKPETRFRVVREKGKEYYQLLYIAGDRTILDSQTYREVMETVRALKESPATRSYFEPDNPFDKSIERFYQLKFRGSHEGVDYRIMSDLLVVDHNRKMIIPCDLKTTGKPEYEFYKSFIEWRYDIQARLYWRIIRQNLARDDYFKHFSLEDYHFIVVNRYSLTPLIWEFGETSREGELRYGRLEDIVMRDPYVIGKELDTYLRHRPQVPAGINLQIPNSLVYWMEKLD